MKFPHHRLMLWRLIDAHDPADIEQFEALTGTTQAAAVDYAIERSGIRDRFPDLRGGRGTPADRLAAARHYARRAILWLVAGSSIMRADLRPRRKRA